MFQPTVGKFVNLRMCLRVGALYQRHSLANFALEPVETTTWSMAWPKNNADQALKRVLELSRVMITGYLL